MSRACLAALCLTATACTPRLTLCEQRGESLDVHFSSLGRFVALRLKRDGAQLIGDVKGFYPPRQMKELRIDANWELTLVPNVGAAIKLGKLSEECAAKVRKAVEPWNKLKEGEA